MNVRSSGLHQNPLAGLFQNGLNGRLRIGELDTYVDD